MRLLLKLMLLAVIGCGMQVGFDCVAMVQQFSIDMPTGYFTADVARTFHQAQLHYKNANGLTRWVVATVFFDPGVTAG